MAEAIIEMLPLFAEPDQLLLTLLRGLPSADRERPTLAGTWQVRDVAAHLLARRQPAHVVAAAQWALWGCRPWQPGLC